ncbi:MAG: SurA N-terminal domain-containing protein [Dysgonamonadaceae bacterium]|jgi:peptidyl-prolyl cis-trans isomerase D|nr:SurA N-terminal domain-containing protein [Dysgonamonadaceae bacterium]
MATLQKIRDRGTLLVIIVGVALLAFVLGDLLTSGTTFMGRAQDRAFVVNGETIPTAEYAERIAEFEQFHSMLSGGESLDENTQAQIREQVYQQMVRERLVQSQATKLGLTVTAAEINDLVHGEFISPLLHQLPFFLNPQTGMFDRNALIEFISVVNTASSNPQEQAIINQYKSLWMFIENMIISQRLEEKYISLLANAVMINDVETKNAFELSQRNADIAFAMQSFFSVPDSAVTVTDREIRDFYNQHRDNFRLEAPLVKLSYFMQEITPSADDFANVEAEARRAAAELTVTTNPAAVVADFSETPFRDVFVNENLLTPSQVEFVRSAAIGDVQGPTREGDLFQVYKLIDRTVAPDSVHLRMMAIPMASAFGQDSLVLNFVDSIYTEMRGGRAFAEVANSLNPQSNGGDVGWARELDLIGSFGADVTRAAFSAPVGQPIRLSVPGQELILQVEERTRPITKYKLALINMPVVASERTTNNIDNELNQFVSLPDVSTRFNELAAERGFMIMPNMTLSASDPGLGMGMSRIPGSRQVITWAANERKMGAVRKFDLTNVRIVARVDEVIPAGTAPLSEVSTGIRMRLTNDRKAEHIIANLNGRNLNNLDAFATAMNSNVDTVRFVNFNTRNITGLGNEPVLNAVSAFAPVNAVKGPMQGNMGVYVASVIGRTQGTEEFDATAQREAMLNENIFRLQDQSITVLRNKLGVEDNRFRFW